MKIKTEARNWAEKDKREEQAEAIAIIIPMQQIKSQRHLSGEYLTLKPYLLVTLSKKW